MLITSSAHFRARPVVSSPSSDDYDDSTECNASFSFVDALQIMINGIRVGGTMSAVSGPARYLNRKHSDESWNGDAEFMLHIDGNASETDNS